MNPLLFADWSRIQRLFHRTMWLLATVLACIVWSAVALRAAGAHRASEAPVDSDPPDAAPLGLELGQPRQQCHRAIEGLALLG